MLDRPFRHPAPDGGADRGRQQHREPILVPNQRPPFERRVARLLDQQPLRLAGIEDEVGQIVQGDVQPAQVASAEADPLPPLFETMVRDVRPLSDRDVLARRVSAEAAALGHLVAQAQHGLRRPAQRSERRLVRHTVDDVDEALEMERAALPDALEDAEVAAAVVHERDEQAFCRILQGAEPPAAEFVEPLLDLPPFGRDRTATDAHRQMHQRLKTDVARQEPRFEQYAGGGRGRPQRVLVRQARGKSGMGD